MLAIELSAGCADKGFGSSVWIDWQQLFLCKKNGPQLLRTLPLLSAIYQRLWQ
jgi:hypothetical protein